uniref:Contactin-associated protein-like 5 n=1 Tax=Sinocyclocheilus rhinocerous TaxID=307959 RepID=A0A673GIY6_9TELE
MKEERNYTIRLSCAAWTIHQLEAIYPLVTTLPPASFQNSSKLSDRRSPHYAKLNRREGGGGWSPNGEDQQPWLQLDLQDRLKVTSIATQGRWGSSDWVARYQLQYSDSGRTWRPHTHKHCCNNSKMSKWHFRECY